MSVESPAAARRGHRRPLGWPSVLILGVALATAMLVGSLWDYAISSAVLNESSALGNVMAAFGWFPALWCAVSAAALVAIASSRSESAWKRLTGFTLAFITALTAPGVGLVISVMYWYQRTGSQLSTWLATLVSFGSCALIFVLAWWLGREAESRDLLRVALLLVTVVVLQMLIIYVLKWMWLRPRMRLVVAGLGVPFEPWWRLGFPGYQEFRSMGIPSDDFKSFPSAHTGNAATGLLFTEVIALSTRFRRFAPAVFWSAAAVMVLVAASRIIVGAHFLTDTVAGMSVVLLIILLARPLRSQEPVGSEGGRTIQPG